ncbi:hypothetical protein HYD79_03770 [Mycoplasmopsis bovis]|nr:hypothetical protein [Mycoplasmopsis bovis]QQH43168.1 hypothetical protein HYD79_03770 [Mycoplasmopsis bovis]
MLELTINKVRNLTHQSRSGTNTQQVAGTQAQTRWQEHQAQIKVAGTKPGLRWHKNTQQVLKCNIVLFISYKNMASQYCACFYF